MRQRSLRSATGALGLGFAIIATLLVAPTAGTSPAVAATATNNPDFTANVMAPLEVSDWNQFSNQLSTVKSYGVDAVTVDDVRAAGQTLVAGSPTLAAIGPIRKLPALERISAAL